MSSSRRNSAGSTICPFDESVVFMYVRYRLTHRESSRPPSCPAPDGVRARPGRLERPLLPPRGRRPFVASVRSSPNLPRRQPAPQAPAPNECAATWLCNSLYLNFESSTRVTTHESAARVGQAGS
jgi:hypothetical protein